MNPQDPRQNPNSGVLPTNQLPQQPYAPPGATPNAGPTITPSPEHSYGPVANNSEHPHAQYEFIMNPGKAPKSSGVLGLASGSMAKRIGILTGGAVVLIVIIIGLASLLGGGKTSTTELVSVVQDQTELIRIAGLGTSDATGQATLNVAYSAQLSLTTSQQQLLNYLVVNHKKVGAKELSLKQNAKTTTDLANALATSTFDSTFNDVMKAQLTSYMQDLKTAYAVSPGPKGRQLLSAEYDGAQLLLQQNAQAQTTTSD